VREPIGFAFVKRAHSQGHFYLRDLFNGFRRIILPIRMPYCILIVFLELKISDIQRFKVVVEVKARMRFV
jgi:phosphoglycerol transferase MdoB-like AlkP superfamily enzyme